MQGRSALVVLGAALIGACAHSPVVPPSSRPGPTDGAPGASAPRESSTSSAGALRAAFVVPDAAPIASRAPIALTASDGTGLAIVSLTTKTELHGPLARTEVHVTFANPEPRQLEGRFRMALPQRAFVSRLAMKIDGVFREADVVPLAVAREVYEETLHRRRDPLLVEQTDNEISARVFPIPPSGVKEIVVGWTVAVGPEWPVVVPLRGLPRIGRLDVLVLGDGGATLARRQGDEIAPGEDVRVEVPRAGAALASGDSLVARVRVPGEASPDPLGGAVVVLFDTSASRAPELVAQIALLRATLARLAEGAPTLRAVVVAFDQECEIVHDGPARSFGDEAERRIRARGALGASDLGAALERAASEATRVGASRALVVGDGVPTAGTSSLAELRAAARALGAAGVTRLDALAVGDVRSTSTLGALVAGALPSAGVVVDSSDAAVVARRLSTRTIPEIDVAVPGAKWSAPSRATGVQPGDEVVVYAVLGRPSAAPRVLVGANEALSVRAAAAREASVVETSVAKAKVDAIVDRAGREGWDDAARDGVIALAQKHRVPSPLTAMLVVESEADRLALLDRAARARIRPSAPAPGAPPALRTAQASSGSTGSTSGVGHGAGRHVGGHKTSAPMLRMGQTTVSGRLPPEVIQRIVRQNFGRFRACYEDGLRRNMALRGRVTTKFTIEPDGSVGTSLDGGSDLPDAKVVGCVTDAFRVLAFPQPEFGRVVVVYPIVFRPADDDAEVQQPSLHAPQRPYYGARYGPPPPPPPPIDPWSGVYGDASRAVLAGDPAAALARAAKAHAEDARDPIALVALGEAAAAASLPALAARAFGSIADLYPDRADMLRAAGSRLDALGRDALAIELLWRARDDRPDQPGSHHLLAMALMRSGRHAEAVSVLSRAIDLTYPARYGDVRRVLRHELAIAGAAWRAAEPAQADSITRRAAAMGAEPEERASTCLTAAWESDASSVSLDVRGGSGESLDVYPVAATQGFGPEAIFDPSPRARALAPVVRYERRGPTGDAMGIVHVMEHDGRGHVVVHPRPFVLMNEGGSLTLALVSREPRDERESPEVSPSSGSR